MFARWLLWVFWVLCAGFCVLPSAWADTQPAAADQVLESFLQFKNLELDRLAREVDAAQSAVGDAETTHAQILDRMGERLQALEVVARLMLSNPYDMRAALAEAQFVARNLEKERAPLENLARDLNLKNSAAAALAEELERKWAATLDKDVRAGLVDIRTRGSKLVQVLGALSNRIDKLFGQYTTAQQRAAALVAQFQEKLPQIWESEFLEPKPFRLWPLGWAEALQDLAEWGVNMRLLLGSQWASIVREDQGLLGVLVLFWLPFSALGLIVYRRLAPLFPPRSSGRHVATATAILSLSLGVSLLAAFFSGRVSQTSVLLVATHALIVGGAQSLGWRLRLLAHPKTWTWQPLLPLVAFFGCSIVLELLRLPLWLFHGVWLALVVCTSLGMGMLQPAFLYEIWIRRLNPWVMFFLVLVAFSGRARLALLGGELWCVGAVAGQLALGVVALAHSSAAMNKREGWRALAVELLTSLASLVVWTGMIFSVLGWLAVQLGSNMVFERLSTLQFNWGEFSFNFLRVVMVFLLFQVVRSLAAAWRSMLENETVVAGLDRGGKASLARVGIYCLWLCFGLVAMHLLGVSLTNLAVIAGGLSVGIGFGLQTLINNFVSGMILLFDRSLRPGDIIELDGLWAVVRNVNIRNTEVQTFDNATILIPNSELISGRLTNWTHKNDPRIRRDIAVGVAYGSDIARVKALLLEAAVEHPAVLSAPAPQVIFANFGASSLDFILRVWLRHVDFSVSAPSELREAIDQKFREAGIEIAFPQMDIHLRASDGVLRLRRG
ncbi:mechanosensitive ion channel protein [Thermodesulfomicrobium sp. WS]|uniref:mechanosensitive ion channel family protein n=1 Tax=Thermodesulfomicrobium sp. WS TaxID=3004129 RepID=UPI002493BA0B|nr:mechanosensitive ion channel domain-containing protein [Thermodesulfomicrobium sp. WS]BDV00211.1 mechanosensitive ion channel protein [Thermodesulfomicrobium sp. WS]